MKINKHFQVSLIKSILRIIGCAELILLNQVKSFAIMFLLAEVLGILEEIMDNR